MMIIGMAVDIIPTPIPEIIFVEEPVTDCRTIDRTGFVSVAVKYLVTRPINSPLASPNNVAQNTPVAVNDTPLYTHLEGSIHVIIMKEARIITPAEDISPIRSAF